MLAYTGGYVKLCLVLAGVQRLFLTFIAHAQIQQYIITIIQSIKTNELMTKYYNEYCL